MAMFTSQCEPDNGLRHSFAAWLANSGQVSTSTALNDSCPSYTTILQQVVAKLPWGHTMMLINKHKMENER